MPYKAHLVSYILIILKFSDFAHKNAANPKEIVALISSVLDAN